jgi:hypothetical protein
MLHQVARAIEGEVDARVEIGVLHACVRGDSRMPAGLVGHLRMV